MSITKRPPKVQQVALAVLIHDGRVLVQRRQRRGRLIHEFPGGRVESGETVADAARRELFEETGISVQTAVEPEAMVMPGETGFNATFVRLSAVPPVEPRAILPSREQTFYWLRPNEIPVEDLHPADREFVARHLTTWIDSSDDPQDASA